MQVEDLKRISFREMMMSIEKREAYRQVRMQLAVKFTAARIESDDCVDPVEPKQHAEYGLKCADALLEAMKWEEEYDGYRR